MQYGEVRGPSQSELILKHIVADNLLNFADRDSYRSYIGVAAKSSLNFVLHNIPYTSKYNYIYMATNK